MTVAAKDLGITTSGVSHALKKLEQDLDCRLFERNTQNIRLTEAGRRFLPDAEGILRQMTEARRKLEPWIDAQRGQLRIGANSTACQYLLPPILREFRESFPEYTVRVDVVSATTAAEALRAQRIDVALILQPTKASQLQFIPLGQEQVGFLVNPLHPWALRKKVLRMDIQKEHFILPERDSEIYLQIDAYFRREKIRIQPFIEIGNEEAIKQFVRLNIGIGIFPSWIAKAEILEGSLATLPIGRRRLARTWGILAPKGRALTFAENVFIGLSRSVVENTISSP
jgi:DNA-binding transcriptional LysR family regulator